jgi:hypothetical protein
MVWRVYQMAGLQVASEDKESKRFVLLRANSGSSGGLAAGSDLQFGYPEAVCPIGVRSGIFILRQP